MSLQKAKAEFCSIKMEKGELDTYIAKFKKIARLAGYDLQDQMVHDRFGSRLNLGLYIAIINNKEPRTWVEWAWAAQKYQQKYLLIRSILCDDWLTTPSSRSLGITRRVQKMTDHNEESLNTESQ